VRAHIYLVAGLLLTAGAACGASIQGIYEGDVRFEHCMALDSRPEVKPTIRKACWDEWIRFYTFGQNRDRVYYARARISQLGAASDFDEGEWRTPQRMAAAVPEPTSALAPPPMMLTSGDAGAPKGADAAAPRPAPPPPTDDEAPPPASDCTAECEETWNACRQDCKNAACEKACTGKYKRCMRKCF
jgi:hypothetical protein